MAKNIHQGHRKRMRERFKTLGCLSGFSEHEILEYFLFTYIPRSNTNDIAHRLINTFGSIDDVFNAECEELVKVKGIGEQCGKRLALLGSFVDAVRNFEDEPVKICDLKEFAEYINTLPLLYGKECTLVLNIDSMDYVRACFKAKYDISSNEFIKQLIMQAGGGIIVVRTCKDVEESLSDFAFQCMDLRKKIYDYYISLVDYYITDGCSAISLRRCAFII